MTCEQCGDPDSTPFFLEIGGKRVVVVLCDECYDAYKGNGT